MLVFLGNIKFVYARLLSLKCWSILCSVLDYLSIFKILILCLELFKLVNCG